MGFFFPLLLLYIHIPDQVIENDHLSAEARFHAMLQSWVRRSSPLPSWSALIRALKCPVIDQADIAAQVTSNYISIVSVIVSLL